MRWLLPSSSTPPLCPLCRPMLGSSASAMSSAWDALPAESHEAPPPPPRLCSHPTFSVEPALTTVTGTILSPPDTSPTAPQSPAGFISPHVMSPAWQGTCSPLYCLALPLEKRLRAMRNFVCLFTDVTRVQHIVSRQRIFVE